MSYYKEEVPGSVVYTTTSYNVNASHQKGRNRLKLFPRFSRKKAAPQPLVVDHSVKVSQSSYGGVVYPSGYSAEKYQISQQSPGLRTNTVCIKDAIDNVNSERITYYESNYTPNTFSHEKYYCPPPSVSSYSSNQPPHVRSNRVQCQPIQTERLRSHQQQQHQQQQHQQQQQYNEDSNLLNNGQHYNSYGGTNSSTSAHTQININNNVNHINEDYNYSSTNNNSSYNNSNQPPSNVDNFIYPPGYLEQQQQQQQQQQQYEYHQENHYSTNQQQCEPVYPMGIEQQNWNFSTQNIPNPYNY